MKHQLKLTEDHKYFLGERELLSVTRILRSVGLIDATYYTDELRDFGKAVHWAIHASVIAIHIDNETTRALKSYLDRPENAAVLPRVEAFKKVIATLGFIPDQSEVKVYDSVQGYAGTLDCFGTSREGLTLLEVKTGAVPWWSAYQTIAYVEAARKCGVINATEPVRRYGVELAGDGRYKLSPFTFDDTDRRVFYAALSICNTKLKHGVKI